VVIQISTGLEGSQIQSADGKLPSLPDRAEQGARRILAYAANQANLTPQLERRVMMLARSRPESFKSAISLALDDTNPNYYAAFKLNC
jgi:hypothetical protein